SLSPYHLFPLLNFRIILKVRMILFLFRTTDLSSLRRHIFFHTLHPELLLSADSEKGRRILSLKFSLPFILQYEHAIRHLFFQVFQSLPDRDASVHPEAYRRSSLYSYWSYRRY